MKKILKIIILIIIIWLILFWTDYIFIKKFDKPIFMIRTTIYEDGGTKEYYGFGYKLIKYNLIDGYKENHIGTWFMKYNPTKYENPLIDVISDFKIIDKTEVCAQSLEKFYEDEEYEYYFSCIKSNNIFINIGKNFLGEDIIYSLKDALNEKIVTIEKLEKNGLSFSKVRKSKES